MGSQYEFEKDLKYNYESKIGMFLKINKTCYSKGEFIKANLFIYPKDDLERTVILNPYIKIKLKEIHYYEYDKNVNDEDNEDKNKNNFFIKGVEKEKKTLISKKFYFPDKELKIKKEGLDISFQIQIPQKAYPSCIFHQKSYVKHYLSFTFPLINAKKTKVIIIKNNLYYSTNNGLVESPVIIKKEISKHHLVYLNSGSFEFTITLPKNFYSYDEKIPFIMDIECANLSFQIRSIKVSLYRILKYNRSKNHKIYRNTEEEELENKTIYLTIGENILHIENEIKLSMDFNERL